MSCETVRIDGFTAIVCGPRSRRKRCGAPACTGAGQYLCDWKTGGGKTCDRPVCSRHARQVADDKHLCPEHQTAYDAWLQARQAAT